MENEKKIVGRCPKCGANVVKTCKGYRCENSIGENPTCNLNINGILGNRKMSDEEITELLANCRIMLDGFMSKEGKAFPTVLELADNGDVLMQSVIGKCPNCGGDIRVESRAFNCSNFNNPTAKCEFSIWRNIGGHQLTLTEAQEISDISLWVNLVNALNRCGKDVRNFKYVCPDNLRMAHDYWVRRMAKIIKEENDRRERERAKKEEADFLRLKSKFFDLTITDGEIEITVLDSIQSFIDERETMHHCVFANRYYAHEDSLIMSARINGERIETIELSLSSLKILQSRAVCNGLSPYHDRIISLVNSNLNEITKRISA